jgi:hypothetical protein
MVVAALLDMWFRRAHSTTARSWPSESTERLRTPVWPVTTEL